MSAPRIVSALDEVEDLGLGVLVILEPIPIEELALPRREETLAHGVVVAVSDAAYGKLHSGVFAALLEICGRVLTALVRVMDDRSGWALPHGHAERTDDQRRVDAGLERSVHDASAEHVEDHGEE